VQCPALSTGRGEQILAPSVNWDFCREGSSSTPEQSKKRSDYILSDRLNVLAKSAGWIHILFGGNFNKKKEDISCKEYWGWKHGDLTCSGTSCWKRWSLGRDIHPEHTPSCSFFMMDRCSGDALTHNCLRSPNSRAVWAWDHAESGIARTLPGVLLYCAPFMG